MNSSFDQDINLNSLKVNEESRECVRDYLDIFVLSEFGNFY